MVRARHLKQVLAAADLQAQRELIRERVGATLLAEIEGASGTDWLPVAYDVVLARALEEVLGASGLAAFNREMMLQSFSGPLLRALVELSRAFLDLDAGAWASWVPRGWQLMFKDCGRWTVVRRGEGEVTLTLAGMPSVCATDGVWPRSVASALSGILPAVGATGTVALERIDPAAGTAVYAMRWRPGRPPTAGA